MSRDILEAMMDEKALSKRHLPMSETAYYILLSLAVERHGYGIMQHVEEITAGRVRIGAGTLYGTLQKMEAERLIEASGEVARRKLYRSTDRGRLLLGLELGRLTELLENGKKAREGSS